MGVWVRYVELIACRQLDEAEVLVIFHCNACEKDII